MRDREYKSFSFNTGIFLQRIFLSTKQEKKEKKKFLSGPFRVSQPGKFPYCELL